MTRTAVNGAGRTRVDRAPFVPRRGLLDFAPGRFFRDKDGPNAEAPTRMAPNAAVSFPSTWRRLPFMIAQLLCSVTGDTLCIPLVPS